ncbi:unnamed protein product, partial [Psylliodes chrysocephalus]
MNSKSCYILVVYLVNGIFGHGMMLEPPGRSSIWRKFPSLGEPNYNDNELFCGGAFVQNELNNGKCGVCGDPYDVPHPQPNENGGFYGRGIIVGYYEPGEVINVSVLLTANHLGYFTYSLCELQDPNAPESGEECFENLLLEDGSDIHPVGPHDYRIENRVVLPNKTCDRCVLRWTYRGGNSWGVCSNGEQRMGCGPQEHFRSCADIKIRNRLSF